MSAQQYTTLIMRLAEIAADAAVADARAGSTDQTTAAVREAKMELRALIEPLADMAERSTPARAGRMYDARMRAIGFVDRMNATAPHE